MACPAAAPARHARQPALSSAAAPQSLRRRERCLSGVVVPRTFSSLLRDAWIIGDAFQHNAAPALTRHFSRAQVFHEHIPHRRALLLIDGGPAGHLIALAGFDRTSIVE